MTEAQINAQITLEQLACEFSIWCDINGICEHGDASELLHRDDVTDDQKSWLSEFLDRWNSAEDAASA